MGDWDDWDQDWWDDYFYGEEDTSMAALADELAESTCPDINWSIFDDNPTSRDLQLFDWEDDYYTWEFDHDEYYDTKASSLRLKSSSSIPSTPITNMDEEAAQQQQFHVDPVSGTKDALAAGGMVDETDDGVDGSLRKKRPDIQVTSQQSESNLEKKAAGQSQGTGSASSSPPTTPRSRRSRSRAPNPNTGPQAGDTIVKVVSEDDEKKVVIVDNGGIVRKLRTIYKNKETGNNNNSLQPSSGTATPRPSPLRSSQNASDTASETPQTAELRVPAPPPK